MALLKPNFMTECPAITAIEPTFMTDTHGKWNLCSTTDKIDEAQDWIDNNLQTFLDTTATENKPPVPQACIPHRIIDYAKIPDLQVDNLYALSGLSLDSPSTSNAWGRPPVISTTTHPPTYSTLSASQTTMNEIVTKLKLMESTLESHDATINKNNNHLSAHSSDHISDYISEQIIEHNASMFSEFDDHVHHLKDEIKHQSAQISGILSTVAAQESSIKSIDS